MSGWKKVGHKKRRGRKANPAPHRQHRSSGALRDPLTRAAKREEARQRAEDERRFERGAW